MMKIVQAVECGIIEEISYGTKTKRKKNIMHAAWCLQINKINYVFTFSNSV